METGTIIQNDVAIMLDMVGYMGVGILIAFIAMVGVVFWGLYNDANN